MTARTMKRSRSGAQAKCPTCGKLLRGEKGVKAHLLNAHRDVLLAEGLTVIADEVIAEIAPSSGAARHLLPAGAKEDGAGG